VLEEQLCLVQRLAGPVAAAMAGTEPPPPAATRTTRSADRNDELGTTALLLRELPGYGLIVPERRHVIRRLLDSQAALAGLALDIRWEVSSIAAIIDLVCAGHGHAVLTANAVAASGRADELRLRPLVEPALTSVLCLATSAHKRPGALMREATELLTRLVRGLPQDVARSV
jgi:LysR family nitrogen assimilation transcriptional regulator